MTLFHIASPARLKLHAPLAQAVWKAYVLNMEHAYSPMRAAATCSAQKAFTATMAHVNQDAANPTACEAALKEAGVRLHKAVKKQNVSQVHAMN